MNKKTPQVQKLLNVRLKTFDQLKVEEIRELARRGEHPNGWFLLETDTQA